MLSLRALRRLGAAGLMFAVSVSSAGGKPAATWPGLVTHVSDGDSLWVQAMTAHKPIEVRLVDLDAPEICQAWGRQARDALKAQVTGRTVSVQTTGRDGYGRMLARIHVDGRNLGAWLVEQGHAWSQRNRWQQGPLMAQESQARAQGRGLHAQAGAVLPRDFRRSHGPCQRTAPA